MPARYAVLFYGLPINGFVYTARNTVFVSLGIPLETLVEEL
jgi:hypothetical protein